jgi:glycosyltransferase involved in cell wall biosynthesis
MEISIVLPCRNEEKSLPFVINQIKDVIKKNNLDAEIILSDSSTDKSCEIGRKFGLKVVKHNKVGYGVAYLEGFKVVKGDYIFMADPDCTYDFNEIPKFIGALKNGFDFVIGDRFSGKIEKKSMPFLHKYFGNPFLSGLFRFFFNSNVKDVHCGMRAISKKALDSLNLQTTGMEFASEMVIKAVKNNLKIKQMPINYHERKGESKLRTFLDGWRHLRFMLLYSPLFLFFVPGIFLFLIGFLSLVFFYFLNFEILGITFYFHPMFLSSFLTLFGYQLIIFSGFAKIYSINHLNEKDSKFEKLFNYFNLEKSILIGSIFAFFGVLIFGFVFLKWINNGFGELNEIKNSILGLTLILIGSQTIFSSFMLSILGVKEK